MTTLDKRLNRLYTPIQDAICQIRDGAHKQPSTLLPVGLPKAKYAIFARQVASASHETLRFVRLAESHGLTPLCFEFHADKFVTRNRTKLSLGHMRFADTLTDCAKSKVIKTVNAQSAQGRPLESVRTVWGQSLIEFHHSLLKEALPKDSSPVLFDGSEWFRSFGHHPQDYYHQFLSLFVSQGVLFETYLLQPDERDFTSEIILPAFESVSSTIGRPMIVQLDPPDCPGHDFWVSYPTSLREKVAERMNQESEKDIRNA